MADTIGWRWSQYIVAIIDAGVLCLLFFTFEETLFPRFLFPPPQTVTDAKAADSSGEPGIGLIDGKKEALVTRETSVGQGSIDQFPKRSYLQTLKPWVYYPQNKTTFFQYFRRPFFLWGFPNVVVVSFSLTPPISSRLTLGRLDLSLLSDAQPVSSLSTPFQRFSHHRHITGARRQLDLCSLLPS